VVDELHAIEAIEDRKARAPAVEHLCAKLRRIGCRVTVPAAEIRPRGERRVGRIGRGFERADAALLDRVAPVFVEMRQEWLDVGDGRVHVAVDGVDIRHAPLTPDRHGPRMRAIQYPPFNELARDGATRSAVVYWIARVRGR